MVLVTGDVHAEWYEIANRVDKFVKRHGKTGGDIYVIICGDFGIWNKSQERQLDKLSRYGFTTLFVDGNHENFDILDSLPVTSWNNGKVSFIRENIIHLKRGQVFKINGLSIFTFGGARSNDISDGIIEIEEYNRLKRGASTKDWINYCGQYRINHLSWWGQEMPNEVEMYTGIANLKKENNKVDYIITHSPCSEILRQMGIGSGTRYKQDELTKYLQEIKETVDFKRWYFGHMHTEQFNGQIDSKHRCLYKSIERIV